MYTKALALSFLQNFKESKGIFDKIKNSEGIVFIYSQFISGGVIPFALFLEQNGFKRATNSKDSQLLDSDDIDCEPLNYDCKKKSLHNRNFINILFL